MEATFTNFSRFLSDRGMKLTRDRRAILEAIRQTNDHFNIDDLYLRMRAEGSQIAKTTIYRALPLLLKSNIIQKVPSNSKCDIYEQAEARHHDHLLCLRCGKTVEFSSEKLEAAQAEACARHGFEPVSHRMSIHGICKHCRKVEAKP